MHSPVFQRWIHTRAHTRIHTHTRLLASTYTRAPQAPAVQLRGTGDSLNSSTRLVSVSPPFSLLCGFCVWVSVSCVCVCVCVVFTPSFNIPCVSSHSLTPLLLAHLVSPLARHCSPPFISSADRRADISAQRRLSCVQSQLLISLYCGLNLLTVARENLCFRKNFRKNDYSFLIILKWLR